MRISFYMSLCVFLSLSILLGAPKQNKNYEKQQLRLAREYEQLGDFDQALNVYQNLYQSNSANNFAYEGIKRILINQKRYEEAIQHIQGRLKWRYTIKVHTELGSVFYMNGNKKEAERIWDAVIEKNEKTPSSYQYVARAMIQNRLYDDAIEIYLKSRKKLKDNELFTIELANLYASRNDFRKATEEYLKYLEKHPTQFNFIKITISRFIDEDKETADMVTNLLNERIEQAPRQINLRNLLVDVYLAASNYARALEQVIVLDDIESKKSRKNDMGRILYEFGSNALTDENYLYAERAFSMIIEKYPESVFFSQAKFGLARSYQLQENYELALQVYQELISENNRSFQAQEALFQIGDVKLHKQFDPAGARTAYENILKFYRRGEKRFDAIFKIGESYFAEGNLKAAREWFNKPLNDAKLPLTSKINALFDLAQLDIVDGQVENAQAKLNEIVNLNTSNVQKQELTLINDALEWILLLEENRMEKESFRMYARTILLEKKRQFEKGISVLDSLIKQFPEAPIIDNAWLQKADFYSSLEEYEKSIRCYRKIIADYAESFYCDFAKMKIGDIYASKIGEHTQAMREYEEFLIDYPQSLYLEDVRRKIRRLERNL